MMDLRALIFVPALVGAAICVFLFLTFAASYYLTILESTAAGAKDVTWVPESITEKFWKPFYLVWLLCLWLGPAYVIGRSLAGSTGVAWLTLAVPVFVAWALYPVSQLSSLAAQSVWIPLHPQVIARLAQKPAVVAGFFAFTLPLFALAGLAFRWAFLTKGEWHLLAVGMPLIVLTGFLYARLLGRLAFALMFTKDLFKRRKKKKPRKEKARPAAADADNPEPPVPVQPRDLPPITSPLDGDAVGYDVLIADDSPAPKKRIKAEVVDDESESAPPPAPPTKPVSPQETARPWTDEDEDATPYTVNPSEVQDEARIPEAVVTPRADEMALLDRRDSPKPPKRVWDAGIFAFLGQPGTISAMVVLTSLGLLAGAMVRVAREFNPVAGAE